MIFPWDRGRPWPRKILEEPRRGPAAGVFVDRDRGPYGDPELAFGNETLRGRSDDDLGGLGARAGFLVADSADDAPVGPDLLLDDLGGLGGPVRLRGGLADLASRAIGRVPLGEARQVGMARAPWALPTGLMPFLPFGPLPGRLEVHEASNLLRGRRRLFRALRRGLLGGGRFRKGRQIPFGRLPEMLLSRQRDLSAGGFQSSPSPA